MKYQKNLKSYQREKVYYLKETLDWQQIYHFQKKISEDNEVKS